MAVLSLTNINIFADNGFVRIPGTGAGDYMLVESGGLWHKNRMLRCFLLLVKMCHVC